MKKSMLIGDPVCFFTKLQYENFTDSQLMDEEDTMGEENSEISYEFRNFKTGKTENGVAFHNVPYFPTHIPAVQFAINVDEFGEGDYAINRTMSYGECLQVFNDLVERGIPMTDITVDMIRQELQVKPKSY